MKERETYNQERYSAGEEKTQDMHKQDNIQVLSTTSQTSLALHSFDMFLKLMSEKSQEKLSKSTNAKKEKNRKDLEHTL